MKKSLFRLADIFELSVAYAFCFSLCLMFDYVKTLEMTSDILTSFFRNFLKYQVMCLHNPSLLFLILLQHLYLQEIF